MDIHAGLVGLKRALTQLADVNKTFNVLEPCFRDLLDRLFAARGRDAARPDLDGPSVALTAGLHKPDLADGHPLDLAGARRGRAGEIRLARKVQTPLDALRLLLACHQLALLKAIGRLNRGAWDRPSSAASTLPRW